MSVGKYANEITAVLEHWCQTHDGSQSPIRFTSENQLRLLRLRTWSLRYYLPVYQIVDILVPILRRQAKLTKALRGGLGIAVTMLTGDGAERILAQELEERFPGKEHVGLWRERTREAQLSREELAETDGVAVRNTAGLVSVLDCETAEDFVRQYRLGIARKRDRYQTAALDRNRRKRPYRWSPWR